MRNNQTERIDIYAEITNQIVEAIEGGADNYTMPWHVSGADSPLPVSAASHRAYRGINVIVLWAIATKLNYETNLWATYQQWRELGAQVRKGEKSASVVFWKFPDLADADETAVEDETDKRRRSVIVRAYHVFNAAQVEGYELPSIPTAGKPAH